MVRLNWWPDSVTQNPFHSAGTERKRERHKGVKARERESESEGEGDGRKGRGGQETFVVEWTSTDNPWHTAL